MVLHLKMLGKAHFYVGTAYPNQPKIRSKLALL